MKTLQDLSGQQIVDIMIIIWMIISLLTFLLGLVIGTLVTKKSKKKKKAKRIFKGNIKLKDGRVIAIEKGEDGLPRLTIKTKKNQSIKPIIEQLNEVYGKPYKENKNDSTKGILDSDGRSA